MQGISSVARAGTYLQSSPPSSSSPLCLNLHHTCSSRRASAIPDKRRPWVPYLPRVALTTRLLMLGMQQVALSTVSQSCGQVPILSS